MSVVRNLSDYRPSTEGMERRVAQLEDGFTRLANALYDELIGADLTKNQSKVAHAICRKTYGFGKKMDRIADSQLAELTRLPRQKVNKAKNELIQMKVIIRDGNKIGPNKEVSEWCVIGCHYSGDNVTTLVTNNVTKTVTGVSPKQSHTKETIQKKKENTPLPPTGVSAGRVKPAKRKPVHINYEACMQSYNELAGERLPHAVELSEERKRKLKTIVTSLATPNEDGFRAYVSAFMQQARPFHFGDNDREWVATFDFLLQRKTLTKVREGTL